MATIAAITFRTLHWRRRFQNPTGIMAEIIDPGLATARKPCELGQDPSKDLERLNTWYEHTSLLADAIGVKNERQKLRLTQDGQPLECVPYVKDLGVTVCSDVSWTRHIEETVAKANRTLGLVKRICKDMHDHALVRPILEYASNLWSPYTIKHKRLVENVQWRATKFILDYPQDITYAERLAKIKILLLEFRRKISDLCLLFKSRTGAITTDVNNHIYIYF